MGEVVLKQTVIVHGMEALGNIRNVMASNKWEGRAACYDTTW